MSLPKIPEMTPPPSISPCDALSLILVSVALEEIALSHIINAEGEKIQHAGHAFAQCKIGVDDLMDVNDNVSRTLRNVLKKEILLELKMVEALEGLKELNCKPDHHHPHHCK